MCFLCVVDDFLEVDGNVNCIKYFEILFKGKEIVFCKVYFFVCFRYCDFQ